MEIGSLYDTASGANSVTAQRARIAEWREDRRADRGAGRSADSSSVGSANSQGSFDSYVERMVSLKNQDGYGRYNSSLNPYGNENNNLSSLYNYGNAYRNPWSSYGSVDSFERCIGLIADALEEKGGTSDEKKDSFVTYDASGRKTKLSKENVLGTGKIYGEDQKSRSKPAYSSGNPLNRIWNFFRNGRRS